MKVRPLHDRVIVERLDEGEQKIGGHHHPGHRQGKAAAGQGHRRRQGPDREGRQGHAARRQGRRHGAVRQVRRPGNQARRQGVPHHARGRNPRRDREVAPRPQRSRRCAQTEIQHGKADCVRRGVAPGDPARRQRAGRRGQGHARPQGPQRRHRQEVRLPHHHQGRRDGRQGDRPEGPAREHGRADGPRSRQQDVGHGRRRHDDRDGARAGDLPRRREERRRRRQPDGAEARHREGRRGHRRASSRSCRSR